MALDELLVESTVDSFFTRSGLTEHDKAQCYELVGSLYPGEHISLASCQGYCSLTFSVGSNKIIQFRPPAYRLDPRITTAARRIHGSLVPAITHITTSTSSLLVYEMERISGVPLAELKVENLWTVEHKVRLCREIARFLLQSWHHGRDKTLPLGTVGSSLASRLNMVLSDLPQRFRSRARYILRNIHCIEALPWVLSHGDLKTSNIMVDALTGQLTGIIDWAEAEVLPFGICLYGLEEVLGFITNLQDSAFLRRTFWTEMFHGIIELEQSIEAVRLARDLGILLWFGIAFDEGAINRVVQEGRDVEEIDKLDAFLSIDTFPTIDTA